MAARVSQRQKTGDHTQSPGAQANTHSLSRSYTNIKTLTITRDRCRDTKCGLNFPLVALAKLEHVPSAMRFHFLCRHIGNTVEKITERGVTTFKLT